jgi:hypothetical protein
MGQGGNSSSSVVRAIVIYGSKKSSEHAVLKSPDLFLLKMELILQFKNETDHDLQKILTLNSPKNNPWQHTDDKFRNSVDANDPVSLKKPCVVGDQIH